MDKEIEEIIRKNLPAQVGDVLQKELKELDKLRKQKETLVGEKEHLLKKLDDAQMKSLELAEIINNNKIKVEQAEDVLRREVQLRSNERVLSYQLESSRERVSDMKELVALAFRNPVLKKSYEHEPSCGGYTGPDGMWHQNPDRTKSKTETIE